MKRGLLFSAMGAGLLAAALVAGWWVVWESGWVAVVPTSPHPANLAAVIDRHRIPDSRNYYPRCVSIGYHPRSRPGQASASFDETRFDHTPAGFRVVINPNVASGFDSVIPKLRFFARYGFLESKNLADDGIEYTMTWKGFVESNESGCFNLLQGRPRAKVLNWEKKKRDGITVFVVEADVSPGGPRPWTSDKEFATLFGKSNADFLEPQRAQFELTRHEGAFAVIAEKGKPVPSASRLDPAALAINARLAGPFDREKVKTMLQAQLDGQSSRRAQLCLPVPQSNQADETDFYTQRVSSGYVEHRKSAYFTFYNLLDHSAKRRESVLKGYAALRKLEELGLAKSELVPATEFKGNPAAGAVRFTLEGKFIDAWLNSPGRCLVVGKLVVDEIVGHEEIEEWRSSVRYWARLKVVPVGELGEKALKTYGHFRRMAEVGVGLRNNVRITPSGLALSGGPLQQPAFDPDASKVTLPVVIGEKVAVVQESRRVERPAQVILQQVMGMSQISRDGLTMTYGGAGASNYAITNVARSRGKWYAEVTLKVRPGSRTPDTWTTAGVARKPLKGSDFYTGLPRASIMQSHSGPKLDDNETVGIAFDADTGRAYFYRNGRWMNGAPDDRGAGVAIMKSMEYVLFAASSASSSSGMGTDAWTFNFGASRFKFPIPQGYVSYDGRIGGSKAGAPAVVSRPAGVHGGMNRCRNKAGNIEYLDKPCALAGMEQLGLVASPNPHRPGLKTDPGGDGIIWIDPRTGSARHIPLTSDAQATTRSR